MKSGDLVKATGPAKPAVGLVLDTLPHNRVRLMWIDDNSVDECSQRLVEVISESD